MYALQHTMPHLIHLDYPLRGRIAPGEKNDPVRPLLRHNINDLLRKPFPSLVRMAVRLMRSYRQTRVQEQDAAVRPRGEQASFLGRGFKAVGVLDFE